MKHALRKYISPCGSALFMVVSTMAALIVLVTAMYMSVLSSRQVQYATFDQEQAYVSSTSLADAVVAMIANPETTAQKSLNSTISNTNTFKKGDQVYAKASELGITSGGIIDSCDVCITRMSDEIIDGKTWFVYDISVTAVENGISETTHTFIRTTPSQKSDPPDINKFFTSTGYLPNDTMLTTGMYDTTMYYNSDYVKFTKLDTNDNQPDNLDVQCGVVTAGTLELDNSNVKDVVLEKPGNWIIGGDLVIKRWKSSFDLGGYAKDGDMITCEDRGRMVIRGNLDMSQTEDNFNLGKVNEPSDLYVLGDLIIGNPSRTTYVTIYGNVYVNGNIIFSANSMWNAINGNIYLNGKIIAKAEPANPSDDPYSKLLNTHKPKVDADGNWEEITSDSSYKLLKWTESNLPKRKVGDKTETSGMTVEKAVSYIGRHQSENESYPKWEVYKGATPPASDASALSKAAYANFPETDINFCSDSVNVMSTDGYVHIQSASMRNAIAASLGSEAEAQAAFEPTHVVKIDRDCTIHHIYDYGRESKNGPIVTLIIDTGDADTVRTINLRANRDTDGDGVEDTFSWRPIMRSPAVAEGSLYGELCIPLRDVKTGDLVWDDYEDTSNMNYINILTVGDGQLVVNVGEFSYDTKVDGKTVSVKNPIVYESSEYEFFGHYAWFMMLGGKEITGPTGKPAYERPGWAGAKPDVTKYIHYAETCDNEACGKLKEIDVTTANGKTKKIYECSVHGYIYSLTDGDKEPIAGKCYCDGKILKDDFPSTYMYDGKTQKPNVNIFIVSASESANFHIAVKDHNDKMIEGNVYFGYYYAPYMTYIDNTAKGRTGLKHVGGMIVSDYVMSGDNQYVFAKPDQELSFMEMDRKDNAAAGGIWKVNGT